MFEWLLIAFLYFFCGYYYIKYMIYTELGWPPNNFAFLLAILIWPFVWLFRLVGNDIRL